MAWTGPVTHAVQDFIDAADWNDEITENHKAMVATAATSVSALNTQWGSPPPDGAFGRLKAGASPFDFLDVRYDTGLTRWVSEPTWHRLQSASWGVTGQTLSTNIEVGNRLHEAVYPWKVYENAGLTLQMCVIGKLGAVATGATGANFAAPMIYTIAYTSNGAIASGTIVTTSAPVSSLADAGSGTLGTYRRGDWGALTVGYTPLDLYAPGVVMNQAGTGTANFFAANVVVGTRWVSQ
jgi:hypothetical protein